MIFSLIESLHTPSEPNERSKVHKILISSEHSFKETYDQTGVSVFLNREHLNSIHTGTTYFGDHHQGFLGCLRDHLYFLNKKGYPQEMSDLVTTTIGRLVRLEPRGYCIDLRLRWLDSACPMRQCGFW